LLTLVVFGFQWLPLVLTPLITTALFAIGVKANTMTSAIAGTNSLILLMEPPPP
jgi:hypothetical protein